MCIRDRLEIHVEKTNSEKAQKILSKFDNWDNMFSVFGGIAEVEKESVELMPENVKALD